VSTTRVLIIPDTHAPYEDKAAFKLVLHVAGLWKPDTIVILGDFFDFYAISDHGKDPGRALFFEEEVKLGIKMLDAIERVGATVWYVEGNHENRLKRHVAKNVPHLAWMLNIQDMLQIRRRGWTFIPYRSHGEIGGAHVIHDVGVAGKNALRRLAQIYHRSCFQGHTHRASLEFEGDVFGNWFVSGMFGWLGDKEKIDYMAAPVIAREWTTAFGTAHIYGDKIYPQVHPITNSKTCVVDGVVYEINP
jgi:predicted phosphodiesterase